MNEDKMALIIIYIKQKSRENYYQPETNIMKYHSMQYNQHAENLPLYTALNANYLIIKTTKECVCDLKSWRTKNKLQLNESKSEFCII